MTANVPDKGLLYQHNGLTKDSVYDVRGDDRAFGNAGTKTGFNEPAPIWLEGRSVDQDATNSLGSFAEHTKSDPEFERYPNANSDPDTTTGGSNTSETVSGKPIPEAKSDAEFDKYPSEACERDDTGNKHSADQDVYGR